MIHYKNETEIALMRESALLVSSTLAEVAKMLRTGITTLSVDQFIGEFIRTHGGVPSFLHYHGYPFNSCISVNDVVVHGFPGAYELREGDVVSVDVGVYKNGFHGDHAYTFVMGSAPAEVLKLVRVTKESLFRGIEKAVAGNRIGDIAFAIQEHTEKKNGYGVVRELVGHGIGRNMHEDPQVPNYGRRGTGPALKEGLVIAIEPMINLGKKDVYTDRDGWTVRTEDGKVSVHFEHDVCVRKGKADILSNYAPIEAAEAANPNLYSEATTLISG
ncbi:MAG TPA: type I methionyl aminopeptidase [Flavisolibacter sp.]